MAPEIEIYDTTLRDGTQGEGVTFSVADKLRIAERLDAFGVHYIEGGWPGSNPKDIEFFEQAKHRTFRHARLAAFGSTRRKDVARRRRRPGAAAPRRGHAGRHDLRQDLAAARPRGAADDAGREPRDDRRHRAVSEGARQVRRLRRRARVRRLQGRPRVRARHAGRPPKAPAPTSSRSATPTADRCRPRSPAITRACARAASTSGSASTRTTTSASASPTRWRRSKPAPRTCRARSTATASAPATAT